MEKLYLLKHLRRLLKSLALKFHLQKVFCNLLLYDNLLHLYLEYRLDLLDLPNIFFLQLDIFERHFQGVVEEQPSDKVFANPQY